MHNLSNVIRLSLLTGGLLLAGCAGTVQNAPGKPTVYQDIQGTGAIAGVGIESQDIVAMTDSMMRDMLRSPVLNNPNTPPRVILDTAYFENQGHQRINKNLIVDRLRIGLLNASAGRMQFVGREYADMVAQERELKRSGQVDSATTGLTRAQAGGDYRLGGRINSLNKVDASSGMQERYNQITFEMVDLENGLLVWSGIYEFRKAGLEDAVYN